MILLSCFGFLRGHYDTVSSNFESRATINPTSRGGDTDGRAAQFQQQGGTCVRAIQVEQTGGPEVLKLRDVAIGEPGPGQALVIIAAAGVNYIEIYQRIGRYPVKLPWIPGSEASGVVEAIGPGVTNVSPGARVAYTGQPGAYAQMAIVQADRLIPLPDGMSFEQGAAFPLQGITAQYLVHEYRKISPGDVVLIHAAAGGMGLLLVQWVKHMGARVIGTVSTEQKAKIAREAGADEVILYTRQDFAAETKRLTDGRGADLILDGVGKTTFPGDLDAVAIRRHIVLYGSSSGPADPFPPNSLQAKALTVSGGTMAHFMATREDLLKRANDVLRGVAEGWLKLRIERVLPLAQAAEAHRLLEGRQTTGKLVLSTAAAA
jgi:NADPH:quinone reductase